MQLTLFHESNHADSLDGFLSKQFNICELLNIIGIFIFYFIQDKILFFYPRYRYDCVAVSWSDPRISKLFPELE